VCVLYDYQAQNPEELTIKRGDILRVFKTHEDGWWEGSLATDQYKKRGLIPSNFVEVLKN
jgi:hypothetical protein